MTRKFAEKELVVATHNQGKLEEISVLLKPFGISLSSNADHNLPEPDETETTFVGNARIKAHAAAQATGLPALADDSGIEIDALGGAPGVYTADWAEGPNGRDFIKAMTRAWTELEAINRGVRGRKAVSKTPSIKLLKWLPTTITGAVSGNCSVPRNSICSRKCARPCRSSGSCLEPT